MKIQLQRTIPKLGLSGEIVEVSDAHARNFLIPKLLAVPATSARVAAAEADKRSAVDATSAQLKKVLEVRTILEGTTLKLTAKANEHGTLFAAIKSPRLKQEIEKQHRVSLTGVQVSPDHWKTVGRHEVSLVWPDKKQTKIIVEIQHGN